MLVAIPQVTSAEEAAASSLRDQVLQLVDETAGVVRVVSETRPSVELLPGGPGAVEAVQQTSNLVLDIDGRRVTLLVAQLGEVDGFATLSDTASGTIRSWELHLAENQWGVVDRAGVEQRLERRFTAKTTCFIFATTPIVVGSAYGPLIRTYGQQDCSPAPNSMTLAVVVQEGSFGNVGTVSNYKDTNVTTIFGYGYAQCKLEGPPAGFFKGAAIGSNDGTTRGATSGTTQLSDCSSFYY